MRKSKKVTSPASAKDMLSKETTRTFEKGILRPGDSFEEWDSFVDESPQGCIFCRSWWLKAVCQHGFEILALRKGGRIVAGIPLPLKGKRKHAIIGMPKLTQTLGMLLAPSTKGNYEARLSNEMNLIEKIIDTMPKLNHFAMNFHYNFRNWLPFYWEGFEQTTRYTYIIESLKDLDKVFSDFNRSKIKNIKKAEKMVSLVEDINARDFYNNHVMSLGKQGEVMAYSYELYKKLFQVTYENHAGKTWFAIDSDKHIHAAIFVVWDNKSAYYLISSIDPDYRNSGAATLLLKTAITYVSKYTERFDFEGSMIRGVENSFRKFGAIQTPYFSISKDDRSLLRKLLMAGRSRLGAGTRRMKRLRH